MNIKKFIHQKPKLFNLSQIFGSCAFQSFFLLVHLTLDCNCHCQNCYQKNNPFYTSRNDFIKLLDFKDILEDIRSSFFIKPNLHFFGGEPLLNPYFGQILSLAQGYKMEMSLTTNGILLDKYLDQILGTNLKQINISIDDIGPRHDKIRQFKGCFQNIIDNIKKIRKKGKGNKKIININCLVIQDNYDHLLEIALYFRGNNIDINILTFQHMYFNLSKNKPQIDLGVLKSQIKKLKKFKANFDILLIPEIKFKDLVIYYALDDNKGVFKNNCNIPWLGLNILPNLEVTPGGGVLGCNQVVGNLKKESLKEIWNNSSMKKFRKDIIRDGLPAVCFRCCHRQYY
ncbi:GTP 3',8-cyclase [subsurface metagenome]